MTKRGLLLKNIRQLSDNGEKKNLKKQKEEKV